MKLSSLLAVLTWACFWLQAQPLQLHPKNPHYFQYRQKPLVIIGSGEHYGAVINLDFDYKKYLQAIAADGLNTTRIFTGAYVENKAILVSKKTRLRQQKGAYYYPGKEAQCLVIFWVEINLISISGMKATSCG